MVPIPPEDLPDIRTKEEIAKDKADEARYLAGDFDDIPDTKEGWYAHMEETLGKDKWAKEKPYFDSNWEHFKTLL